MDLREFRRKICQGALLLSVATIPVKLWLIWFFQVELYGVRYLKALLVVAQSMFLFALVTTNTKER